MNKISCLAIALCLYAGVAFAADSATMIARGNSLFRRKNYAEAIRSYQQALESAPDPSLVHYNIGAAQFKLQELDRAAGSFEKALVSPNKAVERKTNYNLGNAKFKLGVSKQDSEISGAVKLVEQSLNAYKRAMEMGKKDEDVRLNYELAEKKLKELKEKLKNNKQPEKQPNQENQQQDKNQPQGASGNEQQQEGKKEDKKDKEGSQEQKQQGQVAEQQGLKGISSQEAGMLLDDFRQEENLLGMIDDTRKAEPQDAEKGW